MFIQHIRSEYTCEPERFSLLDSANASMYYREANQWPTTYRILGGNDLLPQAIARQLSDLRLGAMVTSLKVADEKTVITYQQADLHHVIDLILCHSCHSTDHSPPH